MDEEELSSIFGGQKTYNNNNAMWVERESGRQKRGLKNQVLSFDRTVRSVDCALAQR